MIYYWIKYLETQFDLPGVALLNSIIFRGFIAATLSLVISIFYGKKIIQFLKNKQVGEEIRNLGLEGQIEKQGTPTMGGIIIFLATLIPTILFADILNVYVVLSLFAIISLSIIGFVDDYIKVFKKDKRGLAGKFKIMGQTIIAIITGFVLYYHDDVTVGLKNKTGEFNFIQSTKTTLPFLKNNEFDYHSLIPFLPEDYVWIIYVLVVIFILVSVSNGANMTDGIDGLAAGSSAIIILTLTVYVYLSGRIDFTNYLNISYIPRLGELTIFCAALFGGCIGFLWYNSYPAQVFMGDTGSIMLGGVIAIIAFSVRKELLIPVICGVYVIENLSVTLQVGWFKFTKKKYGVGRRIFKMAPVHHHFQKIGIHESKIVTRFLIIGVLLSIVSLALLKIR